MQSSTSGRAQISDADAANRGITTNHERMANNELRYRLTAADGSGYIRTVAAAEGAWQNSHFHKALRETYVVQSGWIALVELVGGTLRWAILEPGDVFTTTPQTPHNVYMPGNAVLHTVKHGSSAGEVDWYASPELDSMTRGLDELQIRSKRS